MTNETSASVLIVEDEQDLADLYAEWLQYDGYQVKVVNSGEEALNELRQDLDIVLLDRRMPGLSGDEVLERIVDQGYSCRVAMVTAVEPDFDIIDMGFDDYLVKPISRKDLHRTVDRLLRRTQYDAQLEEYATLVSKMSTLEAEKPSSELESNEKYDELKTEIEQLQSVVDDLAEGFDDKDVAAVLRDITMNPETS